MFNINIGGYGFRARCCASPRNDSGEIRGPRFRAPRNDSKRDSVLALRASRNDSKRDSGFALSRAGGMTTDNAMTMV
jgi:hypothetical protein